MRTYIVSCLFMILVTARGVRAQSAGESEIKNSHSSPTLITNMTQVQHLLSPGIEISKIETLMGRPNSIQTFTNETIWEYFLTPFPASGAMQGWYVEGLMLTITNARLADVGFIYSEHRQRVSSEEIINNPNNLTTKFSSQIKLYIVSSNQIPGGQFIDTSSCPKVGFIHATPDLLIRKPKQVRIDEEKVSGKNGEGTFWSFAITLTDEDGAKLKSFTESNLYKRVLTEVDDEPVTAGEIILPIETGGFSFETSNRLQMERIKGLLTRGALSNR